MDAFTPAIIGVFIVSLVSLCGIIFFSINENFFKKKLSFLVSFSAGTLFGDAFIHLIPEAFFSESLAPIEVSLSILSGILVFLIMEKFLHWHHHHAHEEHDEVHTFTYLNLVGDAIHNFLDGAVIAISFMAGTSLGIATTIAILAHEIPQEIADFSVLIYGGFSKMKALVYNFLTALTAVLGAMLTYFFSSLVESSHIYIASLAIGGFIYIAGTDLIPEIHKEKDVKKSSLQLLMMVLGIALIWFVGKVFEGH